jgi:hypothetical protein
LIFVEPKFDRHPFRVLADAKHVANFRHALSIA